MIKPSAPGPDSSRLFDEAFERDAADEVFNPGGKAA